MKKHILLFLFILMALALTSCRHNEEMTCTELAWDTLTHLYQQEDYTVPGISYQINVVLPKDSLCPAHTAMRQQLLDRLFGTSIAWEPDSLKLDLSDAHKCLDTYLNANQKALDKVAAEYAPGGVGEAQMATASLFWGNELKLSPVMVDDTFITFALFYYNYIGGVHGIYGTYYLTFNAQTGEQVHDKDFFLPNTEEALDDLLQTALMHYCEHNDEVALSTNDFETQYLHTNDNFRLTPDSIYYTFNVYEIASYPVGCHTFGFSAQEAKPYLNPQSIVYQYWKL